MKKIVKNNQNELVVKSNELNIYSLFTTALQLKLFSKIVTLIRDTPNKKSYTIFVSDILSEFGIGKGNYSQIKNLAKKMEVFVDMPKELSEFSNNDEKQHRVAPFPEIIVDNPSTITFFVDDRLKSHLINLTSNFSSYYLKNITQLKSKSSLRLYEILNQYKKIGKIKKNLKSLKLMIGINLEKHKYYANFKQDVLLKAQKELEKKTDISFTFEEIKQGRKVDEIVFHIKNTSKLKNLKPINEKHQEEQKEKIIEAEFEELAPTQEKTASKQPKKEQQKEEYPFTLMPIKTLISIGISKSSIKKEFNQLITEFTKKEAETLFTNFLQQQEIKDVMSGKKQTESKSNYIYQLIKNRSFFNQENLDKIKNQNQKEANKQQEKEDLKEKYQIRNTEPFWQFTRNYLDLKKAEDWGELLKFELLNFSLIENEVMYLILSKSDDTSEDKFHRDNLLREKDNLIKITNKMLEMDVFKDMGRINDLKISIEDEYFFHG